MHEPKRHSQGHEQEHEHKQRQQQHEHQHQQQEHHQQEQQASAQRSKKRTGSSLSIAMLHSTSSPNSLNTSRNVSSVVWKLRPPCAIHRPKCVLGTQLVGNSAIWLEEGCAPHSTGIGCRRRRRRLLDHHHHHAHHRHHHDHHRRRRHRRLQARQPRSRGWFDRPFPDRPSRRLRRPCCLRPRKRQSQSPESRPSPCEENRHGPAE